MRPRCSRRSGRRRDREVLECDSDASATPARGRCPAYNQYSNETVTAKGIHCKMFAVLGCCCILSYALKQIGNSSACPLFSVDTCLKLSLYGTYLKVLRAGFQSRLGVQGFLKFSNIIFGKRLSRSLLFTQAAHSINFCYYWKCRQFAVTSFGSGPGRCGRG